MPWALGDLRWTMEVVTLTDETAKEGTEPVARPRWWLAPGKWWRELLIIGVGFGLYTLIQHQINVSPAPAVRHANAFLAAEQWLGIDVEAPLNGALAGHPTLAVVANDYYVLLHEVVTPVVIVWLFLRRRAAYPYARFLLAVPTLLGFVLYYAVPVAPPRLVPGAGIVDTMAAFPGVTNFSSGPMAHTAAQFAAFPSLHFAWALWAGAMVFWLVRNWVVRALAVCYPACTGLVVIATGNHFVIDLAGGAVVTACGIGLLRLLRPVSETVALQSAPESSS
jgi:hypothetical protein